MEVVFRAGASSRGARSSKLRTSSSKRCYSCVLRTSSRLVRAFNVARKAFTKTHRRRAIDASSFSRLNPLRRRMNRRPLLDTDSSAAAPPRAFFSRASLARRPQDGRRRLDALLAQGRYVVVHLQVARLAHALRPGAVPTGQMREPARVVGRPVPNCSTHRQGRHGARVRRGRQPADAVFRAGPRDAQARGLRL